MAGIFISYRREDSEDSTRAIFESLRPEFGKERLFMDVEAIALGSDFRDAISVLCQLRSVPRGHRSWLAQRQAVERSQRTAPAGQSQRFPSARKSRPRSRRARSFQ